MDNNTDKTKQENAIYFFEKQANDFASQFGCIDCATGFLYFEYEDHAEIYTDLLDCLERRKAVLEQGPE